MVDTTISNNALCYCTSNYSVYEQYLNLFLLYFYVNCSHKKLIIITRGKEVLTNIYKHFFLIIYYSNSNKYLYAQFLCY